MTVRVWNILALAALSRPTAASAALLFEHFATFSLAYNTALAPYHRAQLDAGAEERAHADVSCAYAALKLWLLLARKAAALVAPAGAGGIFEDGEGLAANMVWNELWPPFEVVLSAFEAEARGGNVSVRFLPRMGRASADTGDGSRWRRACGLRLEICSSSLDSLAPS